VIPVLICPVINRFDLLERMLPSVASSVEQIVIVDNSITGYQAPPEIERVAYIRPPLQGLGYGGGINAGIIQTSEAPWWAWSNADIVFGPDDPAEIERQMSQPGPRVMTFGFAWGALNREAIDRVGLIDDWTYHPIYFDDNDYQRRCELGGVEWVGYQGGIRHGEKGAGTDGSVTIGEERFKKANHVSFPINEQRYVEKWGGMPGSERFTTPWDTGYPLWYTKPDIDGKRDRRW